jgi:alkyl sulfatase BDS1-like metallo-beta-lactamase superfamily hydrolase
MLFDYLAVRLDGPKAAGRKLDLDVTFNDLGKQYGLVVENAVLNYGKPAAQPDAKLLLSKATLDRIQLGETTVDQATASGELKIEGSQQAFIDSTSMNEFTIVIDSQSIGG